MKAFPPRPSAGVLTGAISFLIAVACAGAPRNAAAQGRTRLERPVMMDSNGPGTELFVIDGSGAIHELRVMANGLEEYGRLSLPRQFMPSDMAFSSAGGEASLLVAGSDSGSGVALGYSLSGKPLKTWRVRNISSGIDFASKSDTAYVATSDSNEIYRLDLRGNGVTRIAQIDDAGKLGPLAFDEAGQEIYVADVANGRIYRYSIPTKVSTILVTGLSAPSALVFDPDSARLFIADPGRRGVYTVDTRVAKPVSAEFASNGLKAPFGLTLISGNRVAVADYAANSILVFSARGEFLFRFPASNGSVRGR